jgi:hypothetical protein
MQIAEDNENKDIVDFLLFPGEKERRCVIYSQR